MVTQSPTAGPFHRIGEAARLSGVPAASIRYYEKEGLLPAQARTDNQYRLYNEAEIHRLRFVRLCRAMDMSLDEVRTLLALDGNGQADAHTACDTLDTHLAHVRTRLHELQVLAQELIALRSRCDGNGACQVIEALHERAEEAAGTLPLAGGKRHERHV